MKIVGIVGWKNSGKTFLAQKLISFFSKLNLNVASIKHAHHDFDIDQPGTDSYLHRESGANQIIVSSSRRWAKIVELNNLKEKNLNELIDNLDNPDIVIVEGFKKEKHNKIEIINEKTESENYLFNVVSNVICIVSDNKVNTSIKQFRKNDIEKIANFILETF